MLALSIYEQPLNERMRLMMRLESMFSQMRLFNQAKDYYEIQLFLDSLFDVLDFLHRYEIRSELIKELQRYKALLNREDSEYRPTPCSSDTLESEIEQHLASIHNINFNLISALRENELFNSLRQRNFHKSGNCLFEVPAYQFWLGHRNNQDSAFLTDCYERFLPIERCVELILHLVRTGSEEVQTSCDDAIFVKTLDNRRTNQMIRIHMPKGIDTFPRVSGDKHRFAIRFMRQDSPIDRAYQINSPVTFGLQICAA